MPGRAAQQVLAEQTSHVDRPAALLGRDGGDLGAAAALRATHEALRVGRTYASAPPLRLFAFVRVDASLSGAGNMVAFCAGVASRVGEPTFRQAVGRRRHRPSWPAAAHRRQEVQAPAAAQAGSRRRRRATPTAATRGGVLHRAYIGLGSNLDGPCGRSVGELPCCTLCLRSRACVPLRCTAPLPGGGSTSRPSSIAVVEIETGLAPRPRWRPCWRPNVPQDAAATARAGVRACWIWMFSALRRCVYR